MCAHKTELIKITGPKHRVKLEFVAARLGIMPEVLRDRIEQTGRGKTLSLTPAEAENIRRAYEGTLPNTYEKVKLVEGAEPHVPIRTPLVEPIRVINPETPAEASASPDPVQELTILDTKTCPSDPKIAVVPLSLHPETLPVTAVNVGSPPAVSKPLERLLEPRLEPPAGEYDPRTVSQRIHQLIGQLPNPAKRDDAKRQLIEIGQPAITRLIWGMEDPWKNEHCKEVLFAIAKKDRACLDTVAHCCVIALQNPKTVVSARKILTSLFEVNLGVVAIACARGLVSYSNPAQIKEIKGLMILAARKDAPAVLSCCDKLFCRPQLYDHAEDMAYPIAQYTPKNAANFFVRQLSIPSAAGFSKRILCHIAEEIDFRAVLDPCSAALGDNPIKEHVKEILLFCAYLNLDLVAGRCAHIAAVDPQRRHNAIEFLGAISEKKPNMVISIGIGIFERYDQLVLINELMPRIAERNLDKVVERCLREIPNLQRSRIFIGILEKLAETRSTEIEEIVERIKRTPEGTALMERAEASVRKMDAHS